MWLVGPSGCLEYSRSGFRWQSSYKITPYLEVERLVTVEDEYKSTELVAERFHRLRLAGPGRSCNTAPQSAHRLHHSQHAAYTTVNTPLTTQSTHRLHYSQHTAYTTVSTPLTPQSAHRLHHSQHTAYTTVDTPLTPQSTHRLHHSQHTAYTTVSTPLTPQSTHRLHHSQHTAYTTVSTPLTPQSTHRLHHSQHTAYTTVNTRWPYHGGGGGGGRNGALRVVTDWRVIRRAVRWGVKGSYFLPKGDPPSWVLRG